MFKKIITISSIAMAFMFSACGGNSAGESRLETQSMLDDANYDGVISKLANSKNSSNEDNLALGAAYMGRAGLSLSDLIVVVSDSGNSNDNAFGAFISSIDNATKDSKTPLLDLQKATDSYTNVVGDRCNDNNISDSDKDLCIFKGLSQVMATATTFSYIADDISSVFDNNGTDDKLTASTCAMQYAIDSNSDTLCTINSLDNNLTFESGLSYREIEVTTNGNAFKYLLTDRSTVITKGYCSLESFSTRTEDKNDAYYICPVNEDANATELTTSSILVDALNNGVDSISGASNDEDMKNSVDEFKCDVLNGIYDANNNTCSVDTKQEIKEEAIIDYLNNQNGE